MARIKRLDDQVINQIAAGEVVERPASVLKELVENSIDAGATEIWVDLEEGGSKLIAVRDNGAGMGRADAELAVERHATSKIAKIEDLYAIASMGFRGEALASIAAVSRFTLRSCTAQGEGAELRVTGGVKQPVSEWSQGIGTTILVGDLFFNIPARLQFMRKASTEYAYCLEFLQSLSLANLDVSLTLSHNGKETFRATVREGGSYEERMRQRFAEVLGKPTDEFLAIHKSTRFGEVKGLISPPGREKSNAKSQYFFVNQRWVKDKVLRFGVARGYHSHLLKGKYPVVFLQMSMDRGLLDVNVHPAKTELRFQYADEVQNLIAFAIREALRQGAWARPDGNDDTSTLAHTSDGADGSSFVLPPRSYRDTGVEPGCSSPAAFQSRSSVRPSSSRFFESRRSPAMAFTAQEQPSSSEISTEFALGGVGKDESPSESIPWSQLTYFGTFAKCYLFFERGDQMLVVDQHAFHERILFERLSADQALLGRAQPLLMPEEVQLRPEQVAELDDIKVQLADLGFAFEILDAERIEVKAVPALVMRRDLEELFDALAGGQDRDFTLTTAAGVSQHLLATMACHAAVRAGEELPEDELRRLLAEASTVDFYHNCPHGRRVFRWWKVSQVAAWFDR